MKVSVLGHGTVGVGVYEMLCASPTLEAGSVLVREGKNDRSFMRTTIEEIVNEPGVDAVAEAMGGTEPAFAYLSAALRAGKHAVTANKALVCAHGIELARLAKEKGVSFLFGAACGGGVPFLHNLALAGESDEILSLGGILNGTTNFMLDAMQRRGMDYADALAEAQRLGYAEADPTADVSGLDALRKLLLACAVAFDRLPVSGTDCEGIESFTAEDVAEIKAMGLVCRLVIKGSLVGDKLFACVQPSLFSPDAPEASVFMNNNLARYTARNAGDMVFIGQGAGRYPTASAVLRDLNSVGDGHRMLSPACREAEADNGCIRMHYYVRVREEFAPRFTGKRLTEEGGIVRMITESIAVSAMHAKAGEIRKEGGSIFFAAMGDKDDKNC